MVKHIKLQHAHASDLGSTNSTAFTVTLPVDDLSSQLLNFTKSPLTSRHTTNFTHPLEGPDNRYPEPSPADKFHFRGSGTERDPDETKESDQLKRRIADMNVRCRLTSRALAQVPTQEK